MSEIREENSGFLLTTEPLSGINREFVPPRNERTFNITIENTDGTNLPYQHTRYTERVEQSRADTLITEFKALADRTTVINWLQGLMNSYITTITS